MKTICRGERCSGKACDVAKVLQVELWERFTPRMRLQMFEEALGSPTGSYCAR